MKFLKTDDGFFIARDIARLFFVVNFFILYILLGLNTELESEYIVLLSIVIAGPFFCGWACPFGGAAYFVAKLGHALWPSRQFLLPQSADSKLRYLRYVFLALFLYLFVFLRIDYFGEHFAMYMSTLPSTLFFIAKYIAVLIVSLFIPYFFCKYMCWQKAVYNVIARLLGTTGMKRDANTCLNCKRCDTACPMNLPVSSSKSISGVDCFNCFSCMKQTVCPEKHKSLDFYWLGKRVNIRRFSAVTMFLYLVATLVVLYY